MPEGDTLYRIAAALRPQLAGRRIVAAVARRPGPRAELLVGATVESVEARGKNLLIRFDSGLVLRTHLGLRGSWHRYARGERWQLPPSRAGIVLETDSDAVVCFDPSTVELFEARAEALHPTLSALGPDLLSAEFGEPLFDDVLRRFRGPEHEALPVAEALVDQRVLAGVGNVYKSEVLFLERVNPFVAVRAIDDDTLRRIVETSRRCLLENKEAVHRTTTGPSVGRRSPSDALWVYARTGKPCRRCGTPIRQRSHGALERVTYWCPSCQAHASGGKESDR
jgi:endonuclease-8